MTDPERAWTTRGVELGGKTVPRDAEVWVHSRDEQGAEIEFRGRRGRVPLDALSGQPFPRPSLEALRELDPCFGLPAEAFDRLYIDRDNYFEILRCRAHGRRFLSDVIGSWWGSRMTLLADDDGEDPHEVWRRYHGRTDAWHARLGRTY